MCMLSCRRAVDAMWVEIGAQATSAAAATLVPMSADKKFDKAIALITEHHNETRAVDQQMRDLAAKLKTMRTAARAPMRRLSPSQTRSLQHPVRVGVAWPGAFVGPRSHLRVGQPSGGQVFADGLPSTPLMPTQWTRRSRTCRRRKVHSSGCAGSRHRRAEFSGGDIVAALAGAATQLTSAIGC